MEPYASLNLLAVVLISAKMAAGRVVGQAVGRRSAARNRAEAETKRFSILWKNVFHDEQNVFFIN